MASFRHDGGRLGWTLFRILGWIASLIGLYFVLANALLSERLRSIARRSGMEIQYRVGYTLLPGHVHLEGLQIEDRQAGRYRVNADRVDFRVGLLGLLAGDLRARDVESTLSAIEVGAYRLDGRMLGQAEEVRREPGTLSVDSATLRIVTGKLGAVPDPSVRAPLSGVIEAREVVIPEGGGMRVVGALHLTGDDAGALLDVAGLPKAVRFSLEGLDRQAFTIDAAIGARGDDLGLEDVHFVSGAVDARGSYHRADGSDRAVFEVQRGRLVTRITASDGKVDLVTDW